MKIIAFLGFIITSPVSILISILIFLEIRTSVIFKQKRIGLHKKEFVIYKFKTMQNNRITFVGKFLRKLGLDEIPQLVNIIKGDMAFIGPRPLTMYDIERLNWNKAKFNARWNVKPGITGLAQLTKICNADLSMQNDLYYVENKSIILDIKLFLKSLFVPFFGKNTN